MHSVHQSPKLVLHGVQEQLLVKCFDFTYNLYKYMHVYVYLSVRPRKVRIITLFILFLLYTLFYKKLNVKFYISVKQYGYFYCLNVCVSPSSCHGPLQFIVYFLVTDIYSYLSFITYVLLTFTSGPLWAMSGYK